MKKSLFTFALCVMAYTLLSQIIYVDIVYGNNLTGNGSSFAPYFTIQHAIDQSTEGDTVLVQPEHITSI